MDHYERKAGYEEAERSQIFILKAALKLFPPPGEHFQLEGADGIRETAIDAEDCVCRGPEKPHQHWWLPVTGISPNATVTIQRPAAPGDPYRMSIVGPRMLRTS